MTLSHDEMVAREQKQKEHSAAVTQQARVLSQLFTAQDMVTIFEDRLEKHRRDIENPSFTEAQTAAVRGAIAEVRRILDWCHGGKPLENLARSLVRRKAQSQT